jgi:hypothetical protein
MTHVTDEDIKTMFETYGLMVNGEPEVFNKSAVISLLNTYVIDSNDGSVYKFDVFKKKLGGNAALNMSGLLRQSIYQEEKGKVVLPPEKLEQFYDWLVSESINSKISVVNQSGHSAALEATVVNQPGHSAALEASLDKKKKPTKSSSGKAGKAQHGKVPHGKAPHGKAPHDKVIQSEDVIDDQLGGGSHKTKIRYSRKYKRRSSRKNKSYKVRRT